MGTTCSSSTANRVASRTVRPILVLHGFPTCSYDWRHVLDDLTARRRVVIPDMLGYGLSPKPDQPYSLFEHADHMTAVADALALGEVDLVTHDMGDSVGGELLARSLDGDLPFGIRRRVLTNGSIYIDMAQLTIGQQLLLGLPDERMPDNPNDGTAFRGGLTGPSRPTRRRATRSSTRSGSSCTATAATC